MTPYAGVWLECLSFAAFAALAWWFSRPWAVTATRSEPLAVSHSSPPALLSDCSSAPCESRAGPHLLSLTDTRETGTLPNNEGLDPFWGKVITLAMTATLTAAASFAVAVLLMSPLLRTISEGNARQDVLDGARRLQSINQANFFVEQQKSMDLLRQFNDRLKAAVEDGQ